VSNGTKGCCAFVAKHLAVRTEGVQLQATSISASVSWCWQFVGSACKHRQAQPARWVAVLHTCTDHVVCVVCAAAVRPWACRKTTYAAASLQEPRPASMHAHLPSCKCDILLVMACLQLYCWLVSILVTSCCINQTCMHIIMAIVACTLQHQQLSCAATSLRGLLEAASDTAMQAVWQSATCYACT
jgi:hypothetical protein